MRRLNWASNDTPRIATDIVSAITRETWKAPQFDLATWNFQLTETR